MNKIKSEKKVVILRCGPDNTYTSGNPSKNLPGKVRLGFQAAVSESKQTESVRSNTISWVTQLISQDWWQWCASLGRLVCLNYIKNVLFYE